MAGAVRLLIPFCVAALAGVGIAAAQDITPPIKSRPPNFSQLVGQFSISASVDKASVVVEDSLILRVVISGTPANGSRPVRSQLQIFPESMAEMFFVQPVESFDLFAAPKDRWEFAWKLRPKSTLVREIPDLKLSYFSPLLGRYQTAATEPIAIRVTPRVRTVDAAEIPRDLPATFMQLSEERPTEWFSAVEALAMRVRFHDALIAAFLAAGFSWVLWRRCAVPSALHREPEAIVELRRTPEAARRIVADYLRNLLELSCDAPTSAQVERQLKRRGVDRALRGKWQTWLANADAVEFAPAATVSESQLLAARAAELITQTDAAIAVVGPTRGRASKKFVGAACLLIFTSVICAGEVDGEHDPWAQGRREFSEAVKKLERQMSDDGGIDRAAKIFAAAIADQPPTADRYLDMGNALFLAGDLPGAITAFRNGLAIDPLDDTLRRHLDFARRQVLIPAESEWPRVQSPWPWAPPLAAFQIVGALAVGIGCVILPFGSWRHSRRAIEIGVAAIIIGLAAIGLMEWGNDARHGQASEDFVVVGAELPLRAGNGERFESVGAAPLPLGYEAAVIGERGGWLHVKCSNGMTGWLPAAKVSRGRLHLEFSSRMTATSLTLSPDFVASALLTVKRLDSSPISPDF